MNWINKVFILVVAVLAVYWEAAFTGLRHLLGAQIDLLPPLMVYTALYADMATVALLAATGGLAFDSLSENPPGITVLPLFSVGLMIHMKRELILREQTFAQFVLGLGASAVAPVLTFLFLLTIGHTPLFGWGSIWQLIVVSAGGALATPVCFEVFAWLNRSLMHNRALPSSFRADREIRRGRS